MPVFNNLRTSLKKALPTWESLTQHTWLRPVAHHLLQPHPWQLQHESVAQGVGIFGVGGGALSYVLVKLGRRLRVAVRRHRSNSGGVRI